VEDDILCNKALRVRAENRRVRLVDQGAQLQQVPFRLSLRPLVLFELLLQLPNALALFCNDIIGVCRIVAVDRGHRPRAADRGPHGARSSCPGKKVALPMEYESTRFITLLCSENTLFMYHKWLKYTKLWDFVPISKISHATQNVKRGSPEFGRRKQHWLNSTFTTVPPKETYCNLFLSLRNILGRIFLATLERLVRYADHSRRSGVPRGRFSLFWAVPGQVKLRTFGSPGQGHWRARVQGVRVL
jgi:hypothetical protein